MYIIIHLHTFFFLDDFTASVSMLSYESISTENETDYIYDVGARVVDDEVEEEVEGFVLFVNFDENQIERDDFSRLNSGSGAVLVQIIDNDGCKYQLYAAIYIK